MSLFGCASATAPVFLPYVFIRRLEFMIERRSCLDGFFISVPLGMFSNYQTAVLP